jgi:tetratricopeptide (TPR) repeat protein
MKNMWQTKDKEIYISIALIIILGFAAYANSLSGEFLWDDGMLIKNNTHIRSWHGIPKIFTEDVGSGAGKATNFYRPLQMLTYTVEYHLWGLNEPGYHITNIFLHIIAALLIYWLVTLLFNDRRLSALTGILFVIHPVHTEAVSYISGRADPLAAIFLLLSFILYIKHARSSATGIYIAMALSYISAVLSKEISLILPLLLLLYHSLFRERLKPKPLLTIVAISVVYGILRFALLNPILPHKTFNLTILQRLPGALAAISNYIRLLILPVNLHMEYGNMLYSFTDPSVISGIAVTALLIFLALKNRGRGNLISFSICWFFVALLPQSNLYPLNTYMAEHWLYLPSVGFFLLLSKGLLLLGDGMVRRDAPSPNKYISIAVLITLLTFYLYLTVRQNGYWREPISFYKRTLSYAPHSSRVYSNLGVAYMDIERHREAIDSFSRAIEIDPENAAVYFNLGSAYNLESRSEEAIASYKRAIEIDPGYSKAYNNLGNTYNSVDDRENAIASFKKAIEVNPKDALAHHNLGNIYRGMGETQKAIASYKRAIEIDRRYAGAYYSLGVTYYMAGQKNLAKDFFDRAVELDPGYGEILMKAFKPHR